MQICRQHFYWIFKRIYILYGFFIWIKILGSNSCFHRMPNPIEIKDHDYENVSTWCGIVAIQLRHALIPRILSMYFLGMPINLAHCNFLFWLQYTQVLYSEAVCVLFSINKQCLRFFQKLLSLRSFNRFENDKKSH